MPAIPARQPLADAFIGAVLRVDDVDLLASQPLAGIPVVAEGALILRYGVRYLGKPNVSIVPGLIAIDYGTFLTSDEAWTFLLHHSNLYPRAEVFGYRDDGHDEQVFVRQLDLALAPQVLVYADAAAALPVARPVAFVGASAPAPARMLEYLPRFDTLEAWQKSQS